MIALALAGMWLMRRRGATVGKWFARLAMRGSSPRCSRTRVGWIFTEAGRQPWVVQGLLKTAQGVSPIASARRCWCR